MLPPTIRDNQNTIIIDKNEDTIVARMRVREFAREVNLDTISQACISIAVTTLAQKINLGGDRCGRVEMSSFSKKMREGMRVDLVITGQGCQQYESAIQSETFISLLDEISVKSVPDQELVVTVIKWKGPFYGQYIQERRPVSQP
jgi:hypothetical protein